MTPTVSLCVPTIGRPEYFPSLVRAITAQTFRDLEILVLDNASPEEHLRERLEPWARQDPRVRLLRSETRVPMFANFNRGIAAARGRYVVFFHDDDVCSPHLIEKSVAVLERHARAGFSGSNYDYVDEHDVVTERRRWIQRDAVVDGRVYIEDLVTRGRNIVPMPGVVFRRTALPDGFDERISIYFGDFTLLMRIAEEHDVALLHESLIGVRRHAAQESQSMPFSQGLPLRIQVLGAYLDEFAARHPSEQRFVRRLRRRVALAHQLALGYAWLSAPDAAEAQACERAFGDARAARAVAGTLRRLDELGVRAQLGNPRLRGLARRLAPLLRL